MSQETLLYIMTGFVIISAIALCIQAGLLFGIYKASKAMQEQATSIMPQAKSILAKAESTLDQSKQNIIEITEKANQMMDISKQSLSDFTVKASQMLDITKAQLVKLDAVVTDATNRARNQLERAELVVDDTVSRVHHSVAAVHNGMLKPIREIQGVATGVKAAVGVLMRGGRPSVAQATQDDEMFI
jgi:isoleucyl-tRNA synthetase